MKRGFVLEVAKDQLNRWRHGESRGLSCREGRHCAFCHYAWRKDTCHRSLFLVTFTCLVLNSRGGESATDSQLESSRNPSGISVVTPAKTPAGAGATSTRNSASDPVLLHAQPSGFLRPSAGIFPPWPSRWLRTAVDHEAGYGRARRRPAVAG
ncbi:uncharacterized protein [Hetaerina americana]|uniref:uncharacterized protein n=1 Tax=Hetaerina americana TaxID=62018 RepID=UPI003A7F585A